SSTPISRSFPLDDAEYIHRSRWSQKISEATPGQGERPLLTSILPRVLQTPWQGSSNRLRGGGAAQRRSGTHPNQLGCAAHGARLRARFAPLLFPVKSALASQSVRYLLRGWLWRRPRQSAIAARWMC